MSLRFDATVKDLAQLNPRGLLASFDAALPPLTVTLLSADLSTVTTAADLVFGLGDPFQEIIHLDFQAGASATKHTDILVYNSLLHRQYQVPVHSIVILLRAQAAHTNLNGTVVYAPRPARGKMNFDYEVVRLWERPVEELLAGDLATLPLAPLGRLPEGEDVQTRLADVITKVIERLQREAPPEQVRRMLTAAYVLTGLRVPRQVAGELFQGVRTMRESDTYMAIVEEGFEKGFEKGHLEEARKLILRLGRKSLGAPDDAIKTNLAGISSLERLELLLERISEAHSWQDLLAMA